MTFLISFRSNSDTEGAVKTYIYSTFSVTFNYSFKKCLMSGTWVMKLKAVRYPLMPVFKAQACKAVLCS